MSARPSPYKNYPTVSAWQSARAQLIRGWIFEIIGRTCAECGTTEGPMEVNHIWRRTYPVARMSVYKRTLAYWRDVAMGRCNCLCVSCNANWRPRPAEWAPTTLSRDYLEWVERFWERNPGMRLPPVTGAEGEKIAA